MSIWQHSFGITWSFFQFADQLLPSIQAQREQMEQEQMQTQRQPPLTGQPPQPK